jgi:hypothetical protein
MVSIDRLLGGPSFGAIAAAHHRGQEAAPTNTSTHLYERPLDRRTLVRAPTFGTNIPDAAARTLSVRMGSASGTKTIAFPLDSGSFVTIISTH